MYLLSIYSYSLNKTQAHSKAYCCTHLHITLEQQQVPNLFYTLWFVFTAFLVHMHAARKTKIDSVLTALYICVVAFVLSFVHSHVLYVKTDLDGKWIMLWMFASFTICWTLSNLIGDAGYGIEFLRVVHKGQAASCDAQTWCGRS